ncbi:MAG: hypothetical protein A2583_09665 [Bdellovibrionales bacterium RIFOXYD1_FULL_53_11]|nr:MAG: hypothetical protein A2583_09665 [Bdellovibrionales bacterium RIFOXYD1_FULL_53_11]
MKNIFERVPFGLLLVLFLGYEGYGLYSFLNDASSPLLQKKSQIETSRKEINSLKEQLKQAEEFYRTLEAKKIQLRELAKKLDEMKGTLSEQLDVPGFMKTVVTEAKRIGIKVLGLKPKGAVVKEFYIEQPFEMAFHGVYVQLVVFLERIASSQKITRVDNFSIKSVGSSLSKYVELDGTVELKVYRYLASKADELAKSGQVAPAGQEGAK